MRLILKFTGTVATIITLTAMLSCIGISCANAEEGLWTDPVSGISYGYEINNNGLTLTACSNVPSNGIVDIPDSIGGQAVKSIAAKCFDGCANIRIIELPKSVVEMEFRNHCFYGISTLEAIKVEADNPAYSSIDGVLYSKDGNDLIYYPPAKAGTNYNIPVGVTMICESAFNNSAVQSVRLPDSLETIGVSAFYGSELRSIDIPSGVKNIEASSFSHCSTLSKIEFHEGLQFIGNQSFYGTGLTNVDLPDSLTTLRPSVFSHCNELRSVVVSENITEIQSEVFSNCSKLENVVLPPNLSTIGAFSFRDTTALRALYVSSSVTYIDKDAFAKYDLGNRVENNTLTIYSASGGYIEKYAADNSIRFCSMTYSEYSVLRSEGKLPDGTVPAVSDDQGSSGESGGGSGESGGNSGSEGGSGESGGNSGSGGSGGNSGNSGSSGGSGGGAQTEPSKTDDSGEGEAPQKEDSSTALKEQKIDCTKIFKKTTNSKAFALKAKANTELSYQSDNIRVARVSSNGTVTVTGPGTARIIIKAAQSEDYLAADLSVIIKVRLAAPGLKIRTSGKHLARIQWTKSLYADGYKIYVRVPGEKRYRCRLTKSNKVKGVIHRGLLRGKKYSYKIRAFKRVGSKFIYSNYSAARTIKAK